MRFVVLHHTGWPGRADHNDLMIQTAVGKDGDDRVLWTLSTMSDVFPVPPVQLTEQPRHRREYLTFEGEISGNRGRVERVDEGAIVILKSVPADGTLIDFMGKKLNGRCRIRPEGGGRFILERIS